MPSPTEEGSNDSTRFTRLIVVSLCAACVSVAYLNKHTIRNVESHPANGYQKFHQSGFGGIYNINHPAGARNRRNLSEKDIIIPKESTKVAIPSLARENIENLHGHYVHDEHRSPFASFLYDRSKEELDAEQKEYVEKMNKVRNVWGAWDFNDKYTKVRPVPKFQKTPYKDMDPKKFPKKSWQADKKYVKNFIAEARKHVNRVREGIYAEYGHPTYNLDTEEEIQARNKLFEVHIVEEAKKPSDPDGWAWMNKEGFDMYSRKLLHAMITNDEFYYVMGGHSAAAGHGNHFHQSYLMEFANIMEPVLKKLGVRLIARNLAMGGLGTLHFSLGASTLYGEADVLMWDSSMTEKSAADQDLFHKQAILSGERVPVLIGGAVNNLEIETGGNLWYGGISLGHSSIILSTDLDQAQTLPWAVQNFMCTPEAQDVCDRGHLDQCWVPRSDFTPTTPQNKEVGSKVGWHPGWRTHKFTARKQTMLMLKALDGALDIWENGISEKNSFPLKGEYWHVGEIYKKVRSNLTTFINGEGLNKTGCESRLKEIPGLERACRMPFKGIGEFTPINLGYPNTIRAHLKPGLDGYKPILTAQALYEGIDILPPTWKIPEGEVDVHAIAIASTYAAPDLDNEWTKDEDDTETSENSRRALRMAATEKIVRIKSGNKIGNIMEDTTNGDQRKLVTYSDDVVPGIGWTYSNGITGFCDGSPMAHCKRYDGNKCLLYGHNDSRELFSGDGLSGWIVFTLPDVKEGIVYIKMQNWAPRGGTTRTKSWTEVNNGITYGIEDTNRNLEEGLGGWPEDMFIDAAVNGKVVKTYTAAEYFKYAHPIAYNNAFYPFLDDKSIVDIKGGKPQPIDVGLRIRSESDPKNAGFQLTHVYYA